MGDFHEGLGIFILMEPERPPPSTDPYTVSFVDFAYSPGSQTGSIVFGRGLDGDAAQLGPRALIFEAGAGLAFATDAVSDNMRQLFEAVVTFTSPPAPPSGAALYKNGAPIGSGSVGRLTVAGPSSNFIGHSNAAAQPGHPDFQGTIFEMLVYAGPIDLALQQQIENYLLTRWCLR
jgi:hypothetical protein